MSILESSGPAEHVTTLTLNRPEVRNALSGELLRELRRELERLKADPDCRAVVLTGAGRAFSAGVDLTDETLVNDPDDPNTLANGMATQRRFAEIVLMVRSLPMPVIAAVNGPAVGAGMALALACDLRFASPAALFDSKVLAAGLAGCDLGMSWLLPRMIGATRAFEMLLGGRRVGAEEAERIGLVGRLVADGALLDEAVELAAGLATLNPLNVQMTKEVLWSQLEIGSLTGGMELENRTQLIASLSGSFLDRAKTFRPLPV